MTDPEVATTDAMAAPTITVPDRADAPVSEVTERFLRAVVAQVPLDLIEELHLFSPLRQGTVETGIAVLAARVPAAVVVAPEPALALSVVADEAVPAEGGADPLAADVTEAIVTEAIVTEAIVTDAIVADEAGDDEVTTDDAVVVVHDASVLVDEAADDEDVAVMPQALVPEALMPEALPPLVERHTVYTARYRYIIKGPERGKWEASVKAEADAPLVTVETVVRGVQRRAGEESEIVRFTQAQVARALRVPLPPPPAL